MIMSLRDLELFEIGQRHVKQNACRDHQDPVSQHRRNRHEPAS
jgi:hypothetical protein